MPSTIPGSSPPTRYGRKMLSKNVPSRSHCVGASEKMARKFCHSSCPADVNSFRIAPGLALPWTPSIRLPRLTDRTAISGVVSGLPTKVPRTAASMLARMIHAIPIASIR